MATSLYMRDDEDEDDDLDEIEGISVPEMFRYIRRLLEDDPDLNDDEVVDDLTDHFELSWEGGLDVVERFNHEDEDEED